MLNIQLSYSDLDLETWINTTKKLFMFAAVNEYEPFPSGNQDLNQEKEVHFFYGIFITGLKLIVSGS